MKGKRKNIPSHTIYQSRNGINLIDGFYLAKDLRTNQINIISISNNVVSVHYPTTHMAMADFVVKDATGQMQVVDKFILSSSIKKDTENENS